MMGLDLEDLRNCYICEECGVVFYDDIDSCIIPNKCKRCEEVDE